MNVLISGGSGFIGSSLTRFLGGRQHEVSHIVRRQHQSGIREVIWNPEAGELDSASLAGVDAAIHLAAENLGAGRWTRERKRRILQSRVDGTRLLATALAGLKRPPRVLISASAIGYYGDRGDEILEEGSEAGTGFLADVCRQWELAAQPAAAAGIRLVTLRIGMILSSAGGALPRMLTPFRLGIGGPLGSGRQYMSWIALDDLLEIAAFALAAENLRGAVNAVAPVAVTNREFSAALGRVLRRPALVPVPAIALRLLFGEISREVLLAGARVRPAKLLAAGFAFRHPELDEALRHTLGRSC